MRDEIFNSPGLEALLHLINPNGNPDGTRVFPNNVKIDDTKYSNSFKNVNEWFVDCVDKVLDSDIDRFLIEDNVGVFAEIAWSNTSSLNYANIQVVISNGTDLVTSYCDKIDNCDYLRFDLDMNKCGPLLKEPMPHIHCKGKDEPRFPFNFAESENLILEFFSLIYRNYLYDKWRNWLKIAYTSSLRGSKEDSQFDVISEAFKAGKINIVNETYLDELNAIKMVLSGSVNSYFKMKLNQAAKNVFI